MGGNPRISQEAQLIVRDCCVDKLRNRRLHYWCVRGLTTLSGFLTNEPSLHAVPSILSCGKNVLVPRFLLRFCLLDVPYIYEGLSGALAVVQPADRPKVSNIWAAEQRWLRFSVFRCSLHIEGLFSLFFLFRSVDLFCSE